MNFVLLHAADGDRPLRVNLNHVIWYAPSGVGYGDASTRIVTLDGKHLYVRESADQLDGHCSGRAPLIEELK